MTRVVRKKYKPDSHQKSQSIRGAWWEADKDKLHESVWPLIRILRHEQQFRDYCNRAFYSMFVGQGVSSLDGDQYALRTSTRGDLRVNLARAIVSAANSKIAKNKVRVLYLTEGGNWSQQSRAKRITKIVNGTFYSSGFYQRNGEAQRDSGVFDIGAVHFFVEDQKVKCERVPGNELRVDYLDGRYGKPSSLHREVTMPRSAVKAAYPAKEKMIDAASISRDSYSRRGHYISDCIDVVYSWKLPSSPGANDGVYSVCTSNDTLEAEDYKHDYFPFVFHRWEECPYGFYGQSICHILAGVQYSLDKVVKDIQDHVDLSTGFVAVEAGSQVGEQYNLPWTQVQYTGTLPNWVVPPAFSVEKLEWANWLVNRGHEDTGLSQLFVTSRKPDGLDSGKALREYNDQNSERFQMAQQRFEDTHVQAAKVVTGLYEDIYESDGEFKVGAWGQKKIESIDWGKARMDAEDYAVRAVATAFLPTTPSAKLQTVQEMIQGGMIGIAEAKLLLDYPDLERANALDTAPLLNIEWRLDQMLDPDNPKYLPPEPNMDLALAMKMVNRAYNDAQSGGAPEDNLQLLLKFESQVQYMIEQAQPPPAPPPPMAPGGNGAMPPEAMTPSPEMPPPPPVV